MIRLVLYDVFQEDHVVPMIELPFGMIWTECVFGCIFSACPAMKMECITYNIIYI